MSFSEQKTTIGTDFDKKVELWPDLRGFKVAYTYGKDMTNQSSERI